MRRRAAAPQPGSGSLTSLLDVMFILVFVLLVQTAAKADRAAIAAAAPAPPAPAPAPVLPAATVAVQEAARATLARRIEGAPTLVARIAADGRLTALELPDRRLDLAVPLVAQVADRDVGLAYLGDRAAELRLCHVIARELGLADLDGRIVAIAPAAPVGELAVALVAGLRRDAERCLVEQRAFAVLVDPAAIPAAEAGTTDGGLP
ncbi:MAG TPA: hypothetical protein VM734_16630 [Kofleriaceae bacterium]|nr:hypothetical protein [Kofleriaceae bacterium]